MPESKGVTLASPVSTAIAKIEVTQEQRELITRTIAQGATKDELELFFYDCTRRGVHPLDRKIHFTKRGGKYTPVTGIDYMRLRAATSGEYAGNDAVIFEGEEMSTEWRATATVYRVNPKDGNRYAYTAEAYWMEYYPEQNAFMWDKMPHVMLAKCAEAQALRKAFPEEVSGLYIPEEMDQAGPLDGAPTVTVTKGKTAGAKTGGTSTPHAVEGETVTHKGYVEKVVKRPLHNKPGKFVLVVTLVGVHAEFETFDTKLAENAKGASGAGVEVVITAKATKFKNKDTGAPQFKIESLAHAEVEGEVVEETGDAHDGE